MTSSDAPLFIVDNSDHGWNGLDYLQQWSEISSAFDIASGFFEIGALLALDGNWQQLKKIRILMAFLKVPWLRIWKESWRMLK